MSAIDVAARAAHSGRRAERLLLTATFVTWLGNSIHLTASALLLLQTEQTSSSVGWLMIAVAAPQALLSLAFGRLADKLDRRRLCVWCDLISMLTALALPISLSLGAKPSQAAYVTTLVLTGIFAMYLPAVSAIIKEQVPEQRLPQFNANFEIALQAGTLLSTAIGGFVVQVFGTTPVFMFNAATFLASAVCLFAMPRRRPIPAASEHGGEQTEEHTGTAPEVHPGGPQPLGRIGIMYALGAGILTVTNTLIVVLVVQTFGQGAGMLGIVDSLAGIGVLLAATLYLRASKRFDQLSIALAGYLSCAVLLFLNPRWGVVALMFLYTAGSLCFGIARIAARTMLLKATSRHNVGRVFGAANACGLAFSVAVTLVITQVTDRIDVSAGYLVFALVVATVAITGAGLLRRAGYRFAPPTQPREDTS